MKRIISLMCTVIMMTVLTTVLSLSSCKKESQSQIPDKISDQAALNSGEKSVGKLKINLVHVYEHVVNAAGMRPTLSTDPTTPLFDKRLMPPLNLPNPVLAPDGHQITLGEYNMVSGWADVKCIKKGTHVVVHLQGLIPNGVYTIWVLTFKSPGFNPTLPNPFINLNGNGALGAPDGSQNAFKAGSDGTAELSVIMPAESLSNFGSVPNCLGDVYETHIVAAYHSDQLTHGGSPGNPATWVVQFGFPFLGSQLTK